MDSEYKEMFDQAIGMATEQMESLLKKSEVFELQAKIYRKSLMSLQHDGGFTREEAMMIISGQGACSSLTAT